MRNLARLLVACVALLLPIRAMAAITIVTLGAHHAAAASTNVLTTITNDCPIGSTISVNDIQFIDSLSPRVDGVGHRSVGVARVSRRLDFAVCAADTHLYETTPVFATLTRTR